MVDRVVNMRGRGLRGDLGIDLQGAPVPGQFLVKAPGGGRTFSTASGTGADDGLRTDLAANTGAENIGFGNRTVDKKLRETISLVDKNVPTDNSDATAALQSAIIDADTSGGAGQFYLFPKGRMTLQNVPVLLRDRVVISGSTVRSAIVGLENDAHFIFDSLEWSGLLNMRMGFGQSQTQTAIEVKSTSSSARLLRFAALEIAGAKKAGQTGYKAVRTNTGADDPIITENISFDIKFEDVDQPIKEFDIEGNFNLCRIVDGFAFEAPQIAMDLRTHAQFDLARIARGETNGSVAYKQAGSRNIAILFTDIGPSTGPNSRALDLATDADNIVLLSRSEGSTQLGNIGRGNTVIDGGNAYHRRVMTRGSDPVNSDFDLTGWGVAASVNVVKGDDQSGRIIVTAAGIPAAMPTVAYRNKDGDWPYPPKVLLVQRGGGNRPELNDIRNRNVNASGWNFQWNATPIDGESYEFDYIVA